MRDGGVLLNAVSRVCLRCGILSTVFQCPDECVDLTPGQAGQRLAKGFVALPLCRLPLLLSDLLRQVYLLETAAGLTECRQLP